MLPFLPLPFSTIISHLSTLSHFNSSEVDSRSRIRIHPGGGDLIFQFYLLLIKYHHSLSLHLLKREGSLLSRCVIRLLKFIGFGVSIPWKSMCTFYFCCLHNICFFILEEGNFSVLIFLAIFPVIVFLIFSLLILPKLMRYQRCFSKEYFSCGKITFRYLCRKIFCTPKSSRIMTQLEFRRILPSTDWQRS